MVKNTFAVFGILAVLLLTLGLTSAYTSTQDSIKVTTTTELPNPVAPGSTYIVKVNVTNNNGTAVNLSWADTAATSGITATVPANDTLANATSKEYSITYSIPSGFTGTVDHKVDVNAYSGSTKIAGFHPYSTANYTSTSVISGCTDPTATNYNSAATVDDGSCTYSSTTTFCDEFSGEKGDLEISGFEIINNGQGDDEEWEYLDEIEIEVTIENTGNDNINDVMVEIMIKDDNNNIITRKDVDLNDDEIDLGRINDDDEETATFKIGELPIDMSEGDYRIYVRAYEDGNEDSECASKSNDFTNTAETYYEFKIVGSDGATVIVKKDSTKTQTSCGSENVEVRFMVYNTGSNDEDKILVILENSQLGIYEKAVIDNLRDGKGKEVAFYISIPEEVAKTTNELKIYTYYDYDDDEDELDELLAYGESSEDEGDDFSTLLEVLSCQSPTPTVSANLESETEIGKELTVKALVTNNGEENDFVISVSSFEAWASLVSVTPQTASIKKGEFQEVVIKLMPKTAGIQSFNVETIIDGEVYTQSVSVNIAEEPTIFSGISDTTFYLITGIVLLLVLIFFVVLVKVISRPRKQEF
ncbi:putative S-layer protein [archaeon]|jgi:hypothetical protein|nr:putative S-layer protein [archaeon]MBT7128858.1 putative S-layer protein [archaeon]